MILECVLLSASLCHAVKDKPVMALTSAHSAVMLADGITTKQFERRGFVEIDPLTRALMGSKPSWSRMVPLGTAEIIGETWLAERMKTSRHGFVRKLWWLPQALGIAGNLWGIGDNATLRHPLSRTSSSAPTLRR